VAEKAVEEERKVLRVEICQRDSYDRPVGLTSVGIFELDLCEALWCWSGSGDLLTRHQARCQLLSLRRGRKDGRHD
jgi:hypothetical protein